MELIKFPETGFLREKNLYSFVPVSRTTLWQWVRADKFPKPIKLAARTTVWRAEDVRKWIKQQG
ncbi:helix-turn-helix transcriptional regulator [Halodesulfovibrio marinisediminis]|uniref:Transcriptional regulator, AlpA family n=1 Tax=Halodesulfovibrio marinisediminis DSM 17456 TaxID=1121457 RepID=A0A1N6J5S7_9BACT|nr:AlpA family phage regulatory protein [Halodesulfovibrio marinisediminis]SIO39637.1 transcriptional regulator, AlpA family [Halodesulfovibrio marinisediminis DSM 17456]